MTATAFSGRPASRARLIIGLDFGTTYSGVAYAIDEDPDRICVVDEWPGHWGKTSEKCPTLAKYAADGTFEWGYQVSRNDPQLIDAIKLLLDPAQPAPLWVKAEPADLQLKKIGKTAEVVVTDFIRAIFEHAVHIIEVKHTKTYIDLLEKKCVLSVPAVWSEKAMDATLRAARKAGLGDVELIKEPEAAALFTIRQLSKKEINVGDAFTLTDAGGGTVDLITYEVIELKPLRLRELSPASGGLFGSMVVNHRFENKIRDIIGIKVFNELRQTPAFRRAMKTFDENIKPGFTSYSDDDEYVAFPKASLKDNKAHGLVSNILTVTGQMLHEIFEPVFVEIDQLIKAQILQARMKLIRVDAVKGPKLTAIFLVGGFGSSRYLYECARNAHKELQVVQPMHAWSAIARGAVLSQMPNEIRVAINSAPKHYGVTCLETYDEDRDAGQSRIWCSFDEEWHVAAMRWHVHKGDDLERGRKIEFHFCRNLWHNPHHAGGPPGERVMHCKLLTSTADEAPFYSDNNDFKTNVQLRVELTSIPAKHYKKIVRQSKAGTLRTWWTLHFSLLMTIGSGPMQFSVAVRGKEYGSVAAEY